MNRTYQFEKDKVPKNKLTYKPIFETINDRQRTIGFIDNTPSGKGDTYFAIKKWLNKHGGESLASHDDFKNVSKFVDIAKRANAEPNEVIMGLLKKGGIEPTGKLQLKHVLNYLAETQGYKATERAISIHHQSGVGAGEIPGQATRDLQLLRSESNLVIRHAESRIRNAVVNNLAPNIDDINKLKNLGASIKVGGKTFGAGSQTAIGGFKEIEKGVETSIQGWEKADFKKFKTYIKNIGCPGKAAGGRVGFAETGSANCFNLGREKIRTGQIKLGVEEFNFKKLAKLTGGAKGIARATGLGLAWEAAFAPLIAAWMMPKGESWPRIFNEMAYGLPLVGETEKGELKRHMGETGFNVDELINLYGDVEEISDWDPSGRSVEHTLGERHYLQMELNAEINRSANVPGKSNKQRLIEREIQKVDEKARPLIESFYEGPAGQYWGEEKWRSGKEARAEGLASLEEAKAARLEEYRKKGYVAPENWWEKSGMSRGIMGLKK